MNDLTQIALVYGAGMLTASLLAVAILKIAFRPVLIAVRDAIAELRAAASLMRSGDE